MAATHTSMTRQNDMNAPRTPLAGLKVIELARLEAVQDFIGDAARVLVTDALDLAHVEMMHEQIAIFALHLLAALLADGQQFDLLALRLQVGQALAGQLDDGRVERRRDAPVVIRTGERVARR